MLLVLICLRLLVEGCSIQVFGETVNKPFGNFSNASNRHFSIHNLKILLKYHKTQCATAIAQGERWSSAELEAY